MKGYYIVILGSEIEEANNKMMERLLNLGEVRKLMKNMYLLKLSNETDDRRTYVRDEISGIEKLSVYVITLTDGLSTAWTMPKENSNYLKEIIREKLHGSVE